MKRESHLVVERRYSNHKKVHVYECMSENINVVNNTVTEDTFEIFILRTTQDVQDFIDSRHFRRVREIDCNFDDNFEEWRGVCGI